MANEAQVTANLTFAKGNIASILRSINALNVTVAGSAYVSNVQAVGTAKEALVLGDITTPGYAFFKNLDGTNPVNLFPNGTDPGMVTLKAGEVALFRLGTTTPFAQATTATVNLEYFMLPD